MPGETFSAKIQNRSVHLRDPVESPGGFGVVGAAIGMVFKDGLVVGTRYILSVGIGRDSEELINFVIR